MSIIIIIKNNYLSTNNIHKGRWHDDIDAIIIFVSNGACLFILITASRNNIILTVNVTKGYLSKAQSYQILRHVLVVGKSSSPIAKENPSIRFIIIIIS